MSKKQKNGKGKPHPVLKNPIVITVAITLAVLIVFGGVTGIITALRNSRAVITYGGVRIEPSAAAYLATTYKTTFIKKYGAVDDPSFWEAEYERGVTYGDLLAESTEQYLKEIAASAYLFDRYSSLTRDEKKSIKATADDLITQYYGSLDKKAFEAEAAEMGFDYDGLVDALTLIYKHSEAKGRIYGSSGQVLAQGGYSAECNKYYSTFAYTKLLFIRTEYEYQTDVNGDYIRDNGGNILTRPLTDEERTEREADVAELRDAIAALENGTDGQINQGFFNSMLAKYNLDEYTTTGYFFSTVTDGGGVLFADATHLFAEQGGDEILDYVFGLDIDSYGEIDTEFGLCFVYRGELGRDLYASDTYEYFFSDFYADAATYLYLNSLMEVSREVTVKDKYYERVDIVALPYNSKFRLKGGFVSA